MIRPPEKYGRRIGMLRDITLWLLGVPIIAIIAMHLLGILR